MFLIEFVEKNWQSLLWSAGILAAAIGAALLARVIALQALRRLTRRKGTVLGQSLVKHGRGPSLWILPLVAVLAILPSLSLPPALMSALEHITGIGLIGAVAWLGILLVDLAPTFLPTDIAWMWPTTWWRGASRRSSR